MGTPLEFRVEPPVEVGASRRMGLNALRLRAGSATSWSGSTAGAEQEFCDKAAKYYHCRRFSEENQPHRERFGQLHPGQARRRTNLVDTDPALCAEERRAIHQRLCAGNWQVFGAHGMKKDYQVQTD